MAGGMSEAGSRALGDAEPDRPGESLDVRTYDPLWGYQLIAYLQNTILGDAVSCGGLEAEAFEPTPVTR